MPHRFQSKFKELLQPLMGNDYVYLIFTFGVLLLGGIDKSIGMLFILNTLDYIIWKFSGNKQEESRLFIKKVKIYLVIILGVILDGLLGLQSGTNLRTYLILAYSFKEIEHIYTRLASDGTFYIPVKFSKLLSRIKKIHKGDVK